MNDFNGCKPFIDFLFKVQPELSEFMIKKLLFCFVLIFYPLSEEPRFPFLNKSALLFLID